MVLVVKNLPASAGYTGEAGSVPGAGRSPGGGHGNPLQYSCLENRMDRGAWSTTVHRVAKGRTRLRTKLQQHMYMASGFLDDTWYKFNPLLCKAIFWILERFILPTQSPSPGKRVSLLSVAFFCCVGRILPFNWVLRPSSFMWGS